MGRLRLLAILVPRLLPGLGPVLIERDQLRARLAAAELEADILRAQLARERQPVTL